MVGSDVPLDYVRHYIYKPLFKFETLWGLKTYQSWQVVPDFSGLFIHSVAFVKLKKESFVQLK